MSTRRNEVKPSLTVAAAVAALSVLAPATVSAADLSHGKAVYLDKCVRCHGERGDGNGPKAATLEKKPADYTNKKEMAKFTDAELKQIVLNGKRPMPAYQGKLSERDLDDVISYIRMFAK